MTPCRVQFIFNCEHLPKSVLDGNGLVTDIPCRMFPTETDDLRRPVLYYQNPFTNPRPLLILPGSSRITSHLAHWYANHLSRIVIPVTDYAPQQVFIPRHRLFMPLSNPTLARSSRSLPWFAASCLVLGDLYIKLAAHTIPLRPAQIHARRLRFTAPSHHAGSTLVCFLRAQSRFPI